jgi:flagellar hook assembly protein FlgD
MSRFIILSLAGLLLAAGCAEKLKSNYVFPDPYLSGTGTAQITFTDLPASCTIDIYTLNGDPVRTITESDGDGQAVWDLKNGGGEQMASGIYKYVIKTGSDEKKGKLVITR